MPTPKWVTGQLLGQDGKPRSGEVVITLSQFVTIPGTGEVVPPRTVVVVDASGLYTIQLYAHNDLTPTGTFSTVQEISWDGGAATPYTIVVPQTNDGHGHDGSSAGNAMVMSYLLTNPPTLGASPSHISTLTVDG